jgi:hypothetical protein
MWKLALDFAANNGTQEISRVTAERSTVPGFNNMGNFPNLDIATQNQPLS